MASKDLPIDLLKADINNIKKYIQKALQEETINESLLSEGIDTLGNISPTIKPKAFIKYVLKYIELVIIFGNGRDYYTQATVTRKYFNHITDMIPAEVQEEFLRQGTRLVFDYVLEENTENWCIKKELLRFFNDTSLDCKRKVKHDIVDKLPQIYLLKLVDSVTSCADYDLQAVILELIFRMYSQRIIHSKLYELIPESEELTSLFSQIKAVTFDEDLKKFLNTLNAKYDKVFTLLCTDIILDNTCSIPVEEGFDVHFNVWHKALSWYQLQQDEDGHETWELITVFVSNVDIAYTRNKKEEPEKLFLEIKLNGPCLTSLTSYQESRDVIRDITIVTKKSEITDEHLYRSLLQKFFDGKFRILPNENLNILRTDVIPAPENESIEQLPTSNQSDESSLNVLDPATTTLHDSRISSKNISTDESKRLLTSSGSVAEIISIVTTTEHDVTTDLSEHRTSPIKNLTPLKILGGRCTGRAVIYKNLIRSQGSSVEQNFTESIQKTNQNFNISVEESKDETEYSTAIEDPDTSTSELTEQFESMKVVIDHRRSSKEKALSKPKSIKGLKSKNNNQRTKTKKKQNESTTGKHKPGSGNYVIEEDNYVSPPTLTVLPKVKPSPTVDETERDQKKMSFKVSTCIKTTKTAKENGLKTKPLKGIKIKKSKKPVLDILGQKFDHDNENQSSAAVSASTQQNTSEKSVKISASDGTDEYNSQKSPIESQETFSESSKGKTNNSISEEKFIEGIDVNEKSLEHEKTFPAQDETERDPKKMLSSKVSTCIKTKNDAKENELKTKVSSNLKGTKINKSKKTVNQKKTEFDHGNESQHLAAVSALTQQNAKDLLQSVKVSAFDRTREYGSQKILVEPEESVLGTKETISEEFDSNYLLPPTRIVLPKASTSKITVSESKGKADDSISEEECIELIDVKEKSLEQQQTFPAVDETGRDQKKMLSSKVSTCTKTTKSAKDHQIKPSVPSVLEGKEVIKKSKKPMRSKHRRRSDVLDQEVDHDNESQPSTVVSAFSQQDARDLLQSLKISAFDRTHEYGSQKSLIESEENVLGTEENVLGTKEIISEEFDSNYLLPPTRMILPKASTCKITISETKGNVDNAISEEESIEVIDVKEKSLEQQQTFPTIDETGRDQKKMLSSKVSTCTKTTKNAKDHQIKPSVPSVLEGVEVIKKSKKPMRSKHLRRSDVLDQEVENDNESQPLTVVSALTQQDARDLLQSVKISAFDRTHEYDSQKSLIESEESVLSTKEIISEKFDSNYLLPPTRTVLPKASTCKINVSGSKDKMHISISDEECIEVIDVKEETLEQQETFPSVVETERDRTKKSSSKVSSAVKGTKIKKSKKPVRGKNLRRSDILGEEFDHDNESQPSAALSALTQQNASEISVKISAFDEADEYEPQKSPIETEETVSKSSKSKANNLISEDKSIEVIDVKEKTLAQQKTFSAIDETESDQKKMLSSKVSTKSTKNAKEPQLKLQVSSVLKGMEVIKKSKTPVQTKPLLCADILDREKKFENQKEIQSVSGLKEQNIKEKPVKISSCDRKNSIEILVNQEIISENVTEEVNSKYFLPPRLNASPNSTCVEKSFTVTDAEEMLEQQKILPTIEEDERNRKEILSPKVSACIKTTRKAKGKKLKPQQRKKLTTLKEQNTRETPVKISIFDEIEENVTGSNKENEQPALETFADSPIKMKSKRFENEQQTEEEEKIFKPPDAVSPEVSITKYASHESSIHNDLEHGKELGNQKEKPKLSDTTSNLNANLNSKDTEQVLTFPKLIVLLERFDSNLQKKRTISKPIEDVSENRKSEQIQSMSNDLNLNNIEEKSIKSLKGSTAKVEKENIMNNTTMEPVVTLIENSEHQNEKEKLKSSKSTTQSLRKTQKRPKGTQIVVSHDDEVIQDFIGSKNIRQSSFSDPKVKEKICDKEKTTAKLHIVRSVIETSEKITGEKMYDDKMTHVDKVMQEAAIPISKSSNIDLNLKNIEQVPSFNQLVELLDRQSSFSDPKIKEKICDKEKSTAKLQISGEKMYDDKMTHDEKVMQESAVPTSKSTDIGVGLQNIEQSPSFDQLVELLDRYGYGVQKKTTVSKPIEDVSEKSKEPVLSTVIDVKECGLADDEKDTQASTLDIDDSSQVIQAKTNVQEEIIDDDLKQGEKSEGPRSKKIHISESSSDETECEGNSVLDEELNESIIIMKIDKTIGNNKIDLVQPILQNEKDDTCIRNTSVKDIEVTTMLDHSEKNLSEKGQEDIIRRPRALNAVLTDSDMSIEDFSSEVQKLPPADKKDGGEENSVKTLSNEKPLEFDRLAADNKKVISGEKKTKEVNEKNKENNLPPTEPKVIPIERSCIADKTNNSSIRRKRKLYDPNDLSVFSHLEDEVERYEKMTKEQQIEMEEGIDKSNTIDKSRLLLLSSAKEGHSSTTYKKKSASLNFVKKYQDPSINGRINLTTSYVRSKKPKKGTNSRNRSYLSGMITLHKRNKQESSVNISKADRTMLNRTLHKIFGWPDEGDSFLKKVLKKSHANASELKTQEYVESQDENTGSPVIVKAKGPTKKKRLPNDQIRYADLIRARDARSHKAKETFMKILQDIQDDLNDGESLMDMLRKSKEKPTAKEKRSSKNRSRRSKTKANNSSKVKRSNVPQKRRSSTPHRSDQCSSNKKRKIKGTKIARKNSGTSKKQILGETSNNL